MQAQKLTRLAIPALVGFLLLTLWAVIGYWSYSERARVLRLTDSQVAQLTASVQEQTLRLFKMTEMSLLVAGDWLVAHPGAYPNDDPSFVALIDRQRGFADGFLDIRTIDGEGGLRLIPAHGSRPISNVADHEDFRVQADPKTRGFFIGRPVVSPWSRRWIVPVTYPADNGNASVLAGVIDVELVAQLFEAQRMKPNGSITIIRADGRTLFRAPALEGAVGKDISASRDFTEHFGPSDRGVYRIRGVYDGADRIVGFDHLRGYPVIVAVTASVSDVLRPWWRQTAVLCGIALVVSLVAGLLTDRFLKAERAAQKRIEFLAYHDGLTALPNRRLARDRFAQGAARADRTEAKVAFLFLDLDHFKLVNDSLGHSAGDALLTAVAERLGECVRDTDTISRNGGDEFLILLPDVEGNGCVVRVVEEILKKLEAPFSIHGHSLSTSVSIGVSVYPEDGQDFDALMKKADAALYRAKGDGRNTYHFYNEEMNARAAEVLQMRSGLRQALKNGEFVLHYQPQIDLRSGAVIGAEALIRWNHPELGMLAPGRFISQAEESGAIVPIGEWVIGEACRQAAEWQAAGLPDLVVAVNLSAVQFRRGNLEEVVAGALERTGLDARFLELELTESILINDAPNVLAAVATLKKLGIALSIDDFGTGYSSLAYLKRFRVDKLKIDQSFVRHSASDPEDAAIVRTIIQMAKSLNLRTIAEGVEDAATLSFLASHRCDEAQGYHIARPMEAAQLAAMLRRPAMARGPADAGGGQWSLPPIGVPS